MCVPADDQVKFSVHNQSPSHRFWPSSVRVSTASPSRLFLHDRVKLQAEIEGRLSSSNTCIAKTNQLSRHSAGEVFGHT